jgi:hypothetical protein
MKNATFLLSILASATLASCAGISPTRIIGDTVGAAGGALIGNKLSKGNPLITAASAGGGVLLSDSLQAGSKASSTRHTMPVMKRHEAIPPSSSFKLSLIDNAPDHSSMIEGTPDCSKFLYRNGRRTASSSRNCQ